jgi:transposase
MRYAQGGGLTPRARAGRETVRFEAVRLLASGMAAAQVARRLRVSARSVRRWRAAVADGGEPAMVSKGPGGAQCRLDEVQLKELERALDAGPAAHGWREDQRWTLARVAALIWEMFKVRYTLRGVSYLLHRIGYRPQVPQHVAAERDEEQVATWVKESWPRIKRRPPGRRRGSASLMRPGKASARPRPAPGPGAG